LKIHQVKIAVFRHGHTWYLQGNKEIRHPKIACDLAMGANLGNNFQQAAILAENEIKQNTEDLIPFLNPSYNTLIVSSPIGRCQHSARIIAESLRAAGFQKLRQKTARILTEVHNFDVGLYLALVYGGAVNFGGKKIEIDPQKTNPKSFSDTEYFLKDCFLSMPDEASKGWPKVIRKRIKTFETAARCLARTEKALNNYARDYPCQKILVTHGFFTNPLAQIYTGSHKAELPKGSWILLSGNRNTLRLTQMQGQNNKPPDHNMLGSLRPLIPNQF
jgi:broad specificity phosphatase PhoE